VGRTGAHDKLLHIDLVSCRLHDGSGLLRGWVFVWRQQSRPSAPHIGAASDSTGGSQREAQCTVGMLHLTALRRISSGKIEYLSFVQVIR